MNAAESTRVRGMLNEIAQATAQATIAAVSDGRLCKQDEEYVVETSTLIGREGLALSTDRQTHRAWNPFELGKTAESARETFRAQLERCAIELANAGGREVSFLRGDLGLFLNAVARRAADDLSADVVSELTERLIHELLGGVLDWTGKMWLSGIRVSGAAIQIRNGLTLRPPGSADFHREYPAEIAGIMFRHPSIPDSVLEASITSRDRPDLRKEINALSIFRVGAIRVISEDWMCNSIFPYKGAHQYQSPRPAPHSSYHYEVSETEAPALVAFVEEVARQLPMKPTGHHGTRRWLGLKNYFRSLHTASDTEERLGQAIASLEASLLSGEKNELKFRLSLRAASLLSLAGQKPLEVFNNMKAAYDFRSDYAHGGEIKLKEMEEANRICPAIMNYARLAIVKFIEFPQDEERREILSLLDDSLLDEAIKETLKGRLSGGLWSYASDSIAHTQ